MTSGAVPYSRTAAVVPVASEALWVLVLVSVVLALPPAIYAGLSYAQFGLFKPSYYLPYEALFDALRSADAEAIISAPIISVNMTSGELLANMYTLTVDQLVLSVALGTVIGLALAVQLSMRRPAQRDLPAGPPPPPGPASPRRSPPAAPASLAAAARRCRVGSLPWPA